MQILGGLGCIGKTTLIHQGIAELLGAGVPREAILYCNYATPSFAFTTPERFVNSALARTGFNRDSDLYLFFDEAQYLESWQEKLQELVRAFPKARVMAAVSCGAKNQHLPPLNFSEYLRFRGLQQSLFGETEISEEQSSGGGMTVSPSDIPVLNDAFVEYVNSGGFPGNLVADRVLRRDLSGYFGIGDPQGLENLFAVLARNTAMEVSIEELSGVVGVAKNTLRKYLDFLEQAFLIRRLPRLDRDGKPFQRAVAFKVYLTAPSLYAALFGPVAKDDKMFPRLAETALVAQWAGSATEGRLAYASWRGGAIDLMEINPDTGLPVHVYELDWRDEYATPGSKADRGPQELTDFVARTNRQAKAHILTATTARLGAMAGIDITLAPLALYAYWMGRNATGPDGSLS
ncbi:MAG: ATP-binding protein [Rhodospirillales bacterium]|nr:ATP-binding protein [Alphaproteobacteria bacterium]MBL6948443.1 ATP-binding protein [Rhodospirillales bacterium]